MEAWDMKQKEMSLATKKEFAAALKKLMAVKPINKITVRELVAECGMNRNSFYYHFEDIYALFKWMVEAEAVEIVKQYDFLMNYHEVIHFVLDYVENNQYLLSNAYNAIGQTGLKQILYLDFISCMDSLLEQGCQRQGVTLDAEYRKFLCAFYTEAIAGTLLDYIIHPQDHSREKVISYVERLLRTTLPAAIGKAAEDEPDDCFR